MATLLELARMSGVAYKTAKPEGDVKKWERDLSASGWSCTDFKYASGSWNGFQACIFAKGGKKVVAFRGTAQAMDGVADLKLGTGMNSTYFDDGETFSELTNGASDVLLTGHSLGGAIAQVVANRTGYTMATFNAPGVGVIASRNILETTASMSAIRLVGMTASIFRHPEQAAKDVWNTFRRVKGINLCLEFDAVSQIGNHYGKVKRISGTGINPITQHGIGTMISVLEKTGNANLAASQPGSY